MTFEHWWDRPEGCGSTPNTYKGWENSCRVSYEAGAADSESECCCGADWTTQEVYDHSYQHWVIEVAQEVLAATEPEEKENDVNRTT